MIRARPKSETLFKRLSECLPGGVNSPVRACREMGMTPLVVKEAHGDILVDVDGNEYIDYCGSWGALIHGHAHPAIVRAAQEQVEKGSSFGTSTPYEEMLATKVCQLVPSCALVRFVSSGTEATMSACRLARGYTGRSVVVTFSGGYHGHADYFLVQAGSGVAQLVNASSAGIPEEFIQCTISLPYNDQEAFEKLIKERGEEIACVIIEPIAANMGVVPATQEFLQLLRARTKECGALLIFDEVVTGFRVARGGAQELYKITPDLTCFGKIVGAGFPCACFGGSKKIMEYLAPLGPVYQAGTLSGNPVAMRAGFVALTLLERHTFYQELKEKTEIITEPLKKHCTCTSVGSMFTLFPGITPPHNMEEVKRGDRATFKKLFRFLFERGVYIPPSLFEAWFVSQAHTREHLEKTRDLLLEFFQGAHAE